MTGHNSEINLFVSSTSQVEELNVLDLLQKFLNQLVIAGIIKNIWSIQEVKAGSNITQEIALMISRSNMFISLISIDYLNSYEDECRHILDKVEKEDSFFYPIIINHCPWEDFLKLKNLTTFPTDGSPVLSLGKSMQTKFLNDFYTKVKEDVFAYKKKCEDELELKKSKTYWIKLYKNIEDLAYRYTQIVDVPTHFFYEISEKINELEKINNISDLPPIINDLVVDCTEKTSFLLSLASKSLDEVDRLKFETRNLKTDQSRLDYEVKEIVNKFEETLLIETKFRLDQYSNDFEKYVIEKIYNIINNSDINGFNTNEKISSIIQETKDVLSESSNTYSVYIEKELIGKINQDLTRLISYISEKYSSSHFSDFDLHIKHREAQLLDSINYYSIGATVIPFVGVSTPILSVIGYIIGNSFLTSLFFNEKKFKQEFFNTIREEISNTMSAFCQKTQDELFTLIRRITNQIINECRYVVKELQENLEYKIEAEIKIINESRLNELVQSLTLLKEYYLK